MGLGRPNCQLATCSDQSQKQNSTSPFAHKPRSRTAIRSDFCRHLFLVRYCLHHQSSLKSPQFFFIQFILHFLKTTCNDMIMKPHAAHCIPHKIIHQIQKAHRYAVQVRFMGHVEQHSRLHVNGKHHRNIERKRRRFAVSVLHGTVQRVIDFVAPFFGQPVKTRRANFPSFKGFGIKDVCLNFSSSSSPRSKAPKTFQAIM